MDEKMKRRVSKWDVAAELHMETDGHDSPLPEKVDDPCMDLTEVDSIKCVDLTEVDSIKCMDLTEVDSIKCMDLAEVDSIKPILSMNVEGSEINQSIIQSEEERNNNILHSVDICEKTQYSKQFDLEGDCKDDLKKQDWEPASHDRTMAECDENQDKPNREANDMSPDPEERHQSTGNISPIDDRSRSHRKRSRSRSLTYDSRGRSKSPSFVSKQGSETWTDTGRMRGMTGVCRAFAVGKCNRGNECRFLHEGIGLGQIDRHHDTGLTDERGNRPERERQVYGSKDSPIIDTPETNNDTRERPFRRHEEHNEDGALRSRSRSRSLTYDSSSRSKSPSFVSKQGSETWTDKGRMRGMTGVCRAFAVGKCNRGNECRFLHEGVGLGQIDRHHDTGLTDERGNRPERERQVHGSKDSPIIDTPETNNDTRERPFRRHEEHNEDGRGNNVSRQGYRSNEICFDFTIGRCYRGAACRYIHNDVSSVGGWSVRDESRGRVLDRRGGSASFSRWPEHQRFSDMPCKYFLQGHCVHGERCKFFHQVGPLSIPVERSLDRSQHSFVSGGHTGNITSANASELQDQTTHYPLRENESGVSNIHPNDKKKLTDRSLSDIHPAQTQDAHKETQPSEQKTAAPKVCTVAGQNAENRGKNRLAPQLLHAQNFASNSPFQQFSSPLPLKGQMQQVIRSHPQNGKNQFAALQKPPDDHSFNASFYQLNPQNLDSRGQVQQNLSMMSHTGSNFNLNKQIQLNRPLNHNAQSKPDFSRHGYQDIIGARDSRQILPQNVQSQAPSITSHVSNGQNHLVVVPQLSSNPQILNSNENSELTSKNNSIQIVQGADSLEVKPSPFNSDNSITHKVVVVTSEQAAKITGLSASLAQFFGTTASNPQSSAGMTPQPFLNPSSIASLATTVALPPTEVEGLQTNLNQQIHVIENIKQVDDSSSMEVKQIEAQGINKEQVDPEGRKDGESKNIKEAKEIRMFKCTLVEFVKEMLKPKWKEGQLSKEAYKTIVKKVVEKVCGSLQGPNIPQTQEKIDLYLLNSKAKLSKLVQAYVEKFVNS